jgi:hypothetical protein
MNSSYPIPYLLKSEGCENSCVKDDAEGGLSLILSFRRPANNGRGNPPECTKADLGGFPEGEPYISVKRWVSQSFYPRNACEMKRETKRKVLTIAFPFPLNGYGCPFENVLLCAGAVFGWATALGLAGTLGTGIDGVSRLMLTGAGDGVGGTTAVWGIAGLIISPALPIA